MRSRVLQEIVVTETTYVNHMVNFRDLYVLPLQSRDAPWKTQFMLQSEVAVFFVNFEQIVHLNTQFLAEVNRRVWNEYVTTHRRVGFAGVARVVIVRPVGGSVALLDVHATGVHRAPGVDFDAHFCIGSVSRKRCFFWGRSCAFCVLAR